MPYFAAVHPSGVHVLWFIDETTARRADGANEIVEIPRGVSPMAAVKSTRAGFEFYELELQPGEYFPRMARPHRPADSPGSNPRNHSERPLIETIRGQLTALRSKLEDIFAVVHPTPTNFGTYGHEIRNLLILAATEVESHWKGVLTANGAPARNTHDYVKLSAAMKLNEYAIRLPFYPWIDPIRPFRDWVPSESPTKDLPWYDSYNAVKHDRENEFHRATLENALASVCACAVMTFAQFGTSGFHYRVEINSFFELAESPNWAWQEVYCSHTDGQPFVARNYPFG